MILQDISDFIKMKQCVDESALLKHFHLTESSLAPMIAILLKRGKIQKTINNRGKNLPAITRYSYHDTASIPVMTML